MGKFCETIEIFTILKGIFRFEALYVFFRLDETDAFYVDVIHTDANPLMSAGLGMWQTCGHLDFYPNGGRIMAGCEKGIMDHIAEVRKKNHIKISTLSIKAYIS